MSNKDKIESDKPERNKTGDEKSDRLPSSVLYICNHNIIRSPMAEAMTRKLFGNNIYTASAGIHCGKPDPFVTAVMNEIDVDIGDREPQTLEEMDEGYFDLIITLSPTAHHIALEKAHVAATEVEYWPTGDPTVVTGSREQILNAYRDVRNRLQNQIEARLSPSGSAANTTRTRGV